MCRYNSIEVYSMDVIYIQLSVLLGTVVFRKLVCSKVEDHISLKNVSEDRRDRCVGIVRQLVTDSFMPQLLGLG